MTTTIQASGTPVRRRTVPRLARMRDLALVPAIIVLLIVGALIDPVFLTRTNLVNVLQQQTELSLVVLAETLILIGGKFDLSLESIVGLAPALGVALVIPATSHGIGTEWATALAVPLVLLTGLIAGALNGVLILRFGLSAFIVTLGMLITLRGLQIGITGGQSLFELPSSVMYLGNTAWLGLPVSVWLCAVLFAAGIAVLGWFRHGRALYAIGGNADAARAAGIRTDRVMYAVFMIAGVLAALAGLLMTGRLGSIAAAQGDKMIFMVFAAAVIGGVSMNGGKGTLFGALCGVLVLGLVTNILTLAGVSAQWFQFAYGLIILVALVLARLTTGKAQD
ncbi:ABC transporter permease [Dactylosporangium sp. NPDC000555]|uniref:ABC transporter permease n=1 Tax=Dactylosporangium sp. NPDC000555 TaxID=3154260 RepID=UPI0033196F3F